MATGLSGDQLQLVLRRAAELERERETGRAPQDDPSPELDVREIAEEVGIAPEAVQRALAEMNAGALTAVTPAPTLLDRVLGPAEVAVERVVPLSTAAARVRVEMFLEGQLMRVARRFGDRVAWRPEQSVWSRIKRVLDVTQRYELPRDTTIDSIVVPHPDGALIRFVARLEEPRRKRAAGAIAGTIAGVVAGGVGVAVADPAIWDAIAVILGTGMAASSVALARRRQRDDRAVAAETLERFLDHV